MYITSLTRNDSVKAFRATELCFLHGVSVCLSQLSRVDAKILWSLITFNGGQCGLSLTSNTTHLITTKPEGVRVLLLYQY